jgi:magnesium-protoporphyrin IX monomethyl ester (oxidative) cyclase
MHKAMGFDPTDFCMRVFAITNEISQQVFPLLIDLDNPKFKRQLDRLCQISESTDRAKRRGGLSGRAARMVNTLRGGLAFTRLFLLPPQPNALPAQICRPPRW